MAKRARLRRSAPTGNGDGENYKVGYGKPPQHSRFRKGRSGNPGGRRKGEHNLATDVKRTLKGLVKVNEGGRSRKISTQAGMLMLLREKVLKGDARALDRLIELAIRFNNEPGSEAAHSLSSDDQTILAAYAAEIAGASPPSEPSRPTGLIRRPLTSKR
jgi:hypothetical protein